MLGRVLILGPEARILTSKPDCDVLLSYRYHHVIPGDWLAPLSINFHPGPPEYPGIGSTNWALYEGARGFGVTAHHMTATPDEGAIIEVLRFPIHATDTLVDLTRRTHAQLVGLTTRVLGWVLTGLVPVSTTERWNGPRRTRAQLNDLATITPDMSPEERARRIRATDYPGWPTTNRAVNN